MQSVGSQTKYTDIVSRNINFCDTQKENAHEKKKKGKPRTAVQSIGTQTKLYLLQRSLKIL